MFRKTTAACLLALMSLFTIQTAGAQTSLTTRTVFLDSLQTSVIETIAAQDKTVEITLKDSVLTVLRVNSNQNGSTHGGRNNEAASIAGVASKSLATDTANASVHTIRVQYVSRDSAHPEGKVIDTIEFRKNSDGIFEIHTT